MNSILKKFAESASDSSAYARKLADAGIRSVSEVFRGTKIYGALSASSVEQVDCDETHYLLVPLLGAERKYSIYTKRILPPDTGATNSLPKVRVFHVPDETGSALLEQELIANIVGSRLSPDAGLSEFADVLQKVADQIDKETDKISGGLILIGGVVAVVNPLLGIGIAAKALLPSLGAKASTAGAEYVGNKLRSWNKSSAVSRLQKDASKEVRMLKPRIYANPIIRSLEVIATNPQSDFDPVFDHRNWVDQFESLHLYTVTQEAIREVYQDVLGSVDLELYREAHVSWIRSFL